MAKVRVTHFAQDFGSHHAVAAIDLFCHMLGVQCLEITGPAATGIKLGIRGEQRRIAAHAGVNARLMMIPELAGKCAFGCGMARHFVG